MTISILVILFSIQVVAADENKINIMYISWTPSPALEAASQSMAYSSDVVFTYVPSFNTTTWTGPSDELLAAASSGLLMEQDIIFTDMLSSAVFDPMDPSFSSAKDNGTSFVDIRSLGTPEYFDYISDGSSMEPIDTYYNNMGTGTATEMQNAEDLLTYLCRNYGNKSQITDAWGGKIHIVYIGWQSSPALETAAGATRFNGSVEFTYIPSFNTTTWAGPSDELLQAASSGLLLQQDILFTDMLSSAVFDPLSETFEAAHDAGISLVDIRSMGTPEYFDHISDGSSTHLIDTYYTNMGTDTEEERRNAENLMLYLAKEYGNHPEITDKWDTIKIMYLCYAANPALENASLTNPYSQNIEYTYIPSFNVTTWADPSDELLQAASRGLFQEQDVIFCDMLSSSIYIPLNQSFWEAHAAGTVFVDVRSIDAPAYFDHVYTGDENVTLLSYYNNMGTETDAQLNNAENLLIYLAKEYGGHPELTAGWELQGSDTPVLPKVGLYHKDYSQKYFETTQEYLEWYSQNDSTHHVYDPAKPTIGMWFHRSDIANGQMGVVDALISDLESKDCNVIVGFDTFDDIVKYYCDENNQSLVQCVISLKSFRLNYYDNEKGERELRQLNVPVLRGIVIDVPQTPDPADANRGIPNAQVVRMTLGPNLDGIFEYVVIGKNVYDPDTRTSESIPIDSQVDWLSNRSIN
ncbi:MAG: cobaltochelatase subunit CobN, partial [Methanomethylovorans sp.]|nr:cobaltochelatase subunit CobN [Methanomethylovorans sp.]